MITHWELYWILMLDNINVFLGVVTMALFILEVALVAFGIAACINSQDKKIILILGLCSLITMIIFIIFAICKTLLPSTSDAIKIYAVPKILNNEVFQPECKDFYILGKSFMIESVNGIKERIKPDNTKVEKK